MIPSNSYYYSNQLYEGDYTNMIDRNKKLKELLTNEKWIGPIYRYLGLQWVVSKMNLMRAKKPRLIISVFAR